jgi:chorismate dehydratase
MKQPTLLGIPRHLHTKPLTEPLRGNPSFRLVEESRPVLAAKLRENELSAALLSPLDYAKESSEYRIVPKVAVVSAEGGALIRFREGVQHIRTLATDPQYACEIVLAKIILSESFNIEPQIVPTNFPPDAALAHNDAVLLVGDDAFRNQSANTIDVVEEWFELTGTPFVHALWCGREHSLLDDEVRMLQDAQAKGSAGITEIAMPFAPAAHEAVTDYLQLFTYALEEQDREALAEFMKYLYYHGVLPDVADLNFFKAGNTMDDLFSDISPN